ncbi:hypothetical protein [Azospirillum sp. sgz302134]
MNALSHSVRACVDASHLLSTADRYFNATIDTVIAELLQNARRAGAAAVAFRVTDDNLTIEDDGCGIDNPEKLLTLAGSGWDESIARSEDPAGAGFFSLAHRERVTVRSRAFEMELDPAAFGGQREVPVLAAPERQGTEITLSLRAGERAQAEHAVRSQARFAPLPVTLNGAPVEQQPFLAGAAHVKNWRGLRIGVFADRVHRPGRTLYGTTEINFHGLTVPVKLPDVEDAAAPGGKWVVFVDVDDAPELALVLPARREVVENAFLDELRNACRVAIFECVAARPKHRLPFQRWQQARELGIDVPEAEPCLPLWQPGTADRDAYEPLREGRSLAEVADPILVDVGEVCLEQALAGAAGAAFDRMYEARPAYAGYSWYPTRRIDDFGITVTAVAGERAVTLTDTEAPDLDTLVDRIDVSVSVMAEGDEPVETLTGTIPAFAFEADSIEFTAWWVARDAGQGAAHTILMNMTFNPSDDADADSYDTQRDDYRSTVSWHLTRLLTGDGEAFKQAIATAIERLYLRTPDGGPAKFVLAFDGEGRFTGVEPLVEAAAGEAAVS